VISLFQCFVLLLINILLLFGPGFSCYASEGFLLTHSAFEFYVPDTTQTIKTEISYTGTLNNLELEVELSESLTYHSMEEAYKPSNVTVLNNGNIFFVWTSIPLSPIKFTFTVKVADVSNENQYISSTAKFSRDNNEHTVTSNKILLARSNFGLHSSSLGTEISDVLGSKSYIAGENLTISNNITYGDIRVKNSMLIFNVYLPEGWSYQSIEGENRPSSVQSLDNTIEFLWDAIPKNSITFMYTIAVPDDEVGNRSINSSVVYSMDDGEIVKNLEPLIIKGADTSRKDTDTSRNNFPGCFITLIK